MSGDGDAVAGDSVVLLSSSAKARTAAIPGYAASVRRAWHCFRSSRQQLRNFPTTSSCMHCVSIRLQGSHIVFPHLVVLRRLVLICA
jgi:hypothetical protein